MKHDTFEELNSLIHTWNDEADQSANKPEVSPTERTRALTLLRCARELNNALVIISNREHIESVDL
jgi:hypothetical protein